MLQGAPEDFPTSFSERCGAALSPVPRFAAAPSARSRAMDTLWLPAPDAAPLSLHGSRTAQALPGACSADVVGRVAVRPRRQLTLPRPRVLRGGERQHGRGRGQARRRRRCGVGGGSVAGERAVHVHCRSQAVWGALRLTRPPPFSPAERLSRPSHPLRGALPPYLQAKYYLNDSEEVASLLEQLAQLLDGTLSAEALMAGFPTDAALESMGLGLPGAGSSSMGGWREGDAETGLRAGRRHRQSLHRKAQAGGGDGGPTFGGWGAMMAAGVGEDSPGGAAAGGWANGAPFAVPQGGGVSPLPTARAAADVHHRASGEFGGSGSSGGVREGLGPHS